MSTSRSDPQDFYEYDVLLSHSDSQKAWARDLARRLHGEGLKVWFNEWRFQSEESWSRDLARGMEASRKIVLALSPKFLDTRWPIFAAHIPILKDPSIRDTRLITLIHTQCDLPQELASYEVVDFRDTHDDDLRYEFRLAQLMAHLDPSRERPTDFDLFCSASDDLPQVGQLPGGSLAPFLPNPNFVGRAEELRLLYEKFTTDDMTSLAPTVALTGLGGIGKTQLAVEFVYRYGRRFSGGVFWVDVSDPDNILDEIICCAGPEGMDLRSPSAISPDELVASVMREWRGEQRRLVVFDGLENLDVIDRWRPASAGTRVLITSWIDGHDPRWAERGVETIPLDVLPREQSIPLLCRGRRDAMDDHDESAAANAICELLGDLPLALHLAGAYLNRYRYEVSLKEYLSELRSRPVLTSATLMDSVHSVSPTLYYQDVPATFDAIVGKLDQFDEEGDTDLIAAKLLHLISHFAPASISRQLLIRALKMDENRSHDRRKVADAVNRLHELGLVQSCPNGRIIVHPLLREYAYEHPAQKQDVHEAAEDVARIIGNFVSELNRSDQTDQLNAELEHTKYAALEAERRGSPIAASLCNQIGYHLHRTADLEGAREYYKRALEIDEAVLGANHPKVAVRNNSLGLVLRGLGDLTGAKQHYRRAVKIYEAVHGADHPEVAIVVNNLGRVLYELGDLQGAKEHFTRALQIDEAAHGADHPAAAKDVNNLGSVLRDLGDLAGAKEHFTRALQIDEAAYGSGHPKVATLINNLGKVEHQLGDLEGAKEHYTRALQIDGEIYGPDHLNVARDAANLGVVLKDIGDLEGAEKRFRWALNILEQRLGAEHFRTQAVRKDLQNLLNADAHEASAE